MPRKPRIHVPGAVYHVMLRGNAGQDIFIDDEDRTRLLLLMQQYVTAWLIRDSEHLSVTEFGRLVGRNVRSLCQGINRLLKRAGSNEEVKDRMQHAQLRLECP